MAKQLLSVTVLAMLLGPAVAQDDYLSENKAKSVRQDAKQDKAKDDKPKPSELDAKDLDAIAKQVDKQVVVKGKVHSTHFPDSKNLFILNLGPDFRNCFKIVVQKADFEKWTDGVDGIKKLYDGKNVTVEGTVSMFREKPEVKIKTPSQIKVVDK